jgi:hypothetical protein
LGYFREVYGTARVPFEDEMNLCNTLINYLKKFNTSCDEEESEPLPRASGWSLIKGTVHQSSTSPVLTYVS